MIVISKINGSRIVSGFRYIKSLLFGKNNTVDAYECAPYGVDSNPIANVKGIYATSSSNSMGVNLGYINTSRVAQAGEYRTYSTNSAGAVMFYVYLKNDGTAEIGGNTKHMVRYEDLDSAIQLLVSDINNNLTLIQSAITSLGGIYVSVPVTCNTIAAKINEIKTL